jgi:hypothetical protein
VGSPSRGQPSSLSGDSEGVLLEQCSYRRHTACSQCHRSHQPLQAASQGAGGSHPCAPWAPALRRIGAILDRAIAQSCWHADLTDLADLAHQRRALPCSLQQAAAELLSLVFVSGRMQNGTCECHAVGWESRFKPKVSTSLLAETSLRR